MLLSYVPKKDRAVLLTSSRHHSACYGPVDTLVRNGLGIRLVVEHVVGPWLSSVLCWISPK
jgi:hypothetical protein